MSAARYCRGTRSSYESAPARLSRSASADQQVALVSDRPAPERWVVQQRRGELLAMAPNQALALRCSQAGPCRPAALHEHEHARLPEQSHPRAHRLRRIRQRPQDVTTEHHVVRRGLNQRAPGRRRPRTAPPRLGRRAFSTGCSDHALREVDPMNVIAGLTEQYGEAARPAADIEDRATVPAAAREGSGRPRQHEHRGRASRGRARRRRWRHAHPTPATPSTQA